MLTIELPFDAFKKLHSALLDTREGYEVAERDGETPALKSLFQGMIELRDKDHEAIHQVLVSNGERADDSGSFMATIHRTAISIRAAVTGLDNDALAPFISGEESIVGEYDAALDEAEDDTTRDLLNDQKAELLSRIGEMKAMKAA